MIDNMNKINQNMDKYKNNNRKIKFIVNIDEILRLIKTLGNINSDGNKKNQQEININIQGFDLNKIKNIRKITDKCGLGGNSNIYDGFCFFISKKDEYVLAFIDANSENKSIIFYDVNNNNEIKKINNAHNKAIHIIKYYECSLYDLILSSSKNDDIKIWNYNDCSNILTISQIFNESNGVYSSCLIIDNNISHIFCVGNLNYIKVYDSNGNLYKNIGKNDEYRRYIDSCEINEKRYIISGGNKGITVFNYPDLSEYYCFIENNDTKYHNYAKIIKIKDIYYLIDVGNFNMIKIWDFFNKTLIANISSDNSSGLTGFITINNRYLIIGSRGNGSIKVFDIQKRIIIKSFDNQHSNNVLGIKIIKDKNGKIYIVSYGNDKNMFLWNLE